MHDLLTPHDRVRLALAGREPDRVPVFNIVRDDRAFDLLGKTLRTMSGTSICLLVADLSPRYPVQILEQDGSRVVRTTPYGSVVRVPADRSAPPQTVGYAIKTRIDWGLLAPRLEPARDRIDWDTVEVAYQAARAAGLYVAVALHVGFEACAALAGAPALVDLMGDDPGLVREIAGAQAGLAMGMADLLHSEGYEIDAALLFDEMAGRRGPLFPVRRYRETLGPVHRRLVDHFHRRDMPVILYSGGDLRLLIPDLVEVGFDGLGPLEVAAGMDLPVLKLNYGTDLTLLGGIDRRALSHPDPVVLEREIAVKVSAAMVNGRYVAGLDGPLPPDVPAELVARFAAMLAKHGRY